VEDVFVTEEVRDLVARAVAEDLGSGDLTSDALFEAGAKARGRVVVRAPGVFAGGPLARLVYGRIDPEVTVELPAAEGARVAEGDEVALVAGPARSILAGERTTLNFLGRASGVATLARLYVDAVAGTGAEIYDTRKTVPGWRILDKYAARTGGATNHRMGLYDQVLIKDNHLAALGGSRREAIAEAVRRAREAVGRRVLVEVEAEGLEEVEAALGTGADVILLDNMSVADMKRAVEAARAAGRARARLEASGGVTLGTVRRIAETGVDAISVGAITHSAPALDLSMEFEAAEEQGSE
jgi:nicotinate-nucleotide pyrophosphorylase (carboxylating)